MARAAAWGRAHLLQVGYGATKKGGVKVDQQRTRRLLVARVEQDGDCSPECEGHGGGCAEGDAVQLRRSALAHEGQICVDELVEELRGPISRRRYNGTRDRRSAVDAVCVGDQHRLQSIAHTKHAPCARMGEALQKLPPGEVPQKLIFHLGLGNAPE